MQQMYLIKSIAIGLLIISTNNFGTEPHSTRITKKVDQKTKINSYVEKITQNRYYEVDAIRQENHIL